MKLSRTRRNRVIRRLISATFLVLLLPGCAAIVSNATQGMANSVGQAILNQDDPDLVRDGAPAFMLMLDGAVSADPENVALLLSAARLYGVYAGVFVLDNPERTRKLALRARNYAASALCAARSDQCHLLEGGFDRFQASLKEFGDSDMDVLFGYAAAWVGWISAASGDWHALAQLPKITGMLEYILPHKTAQESADVLMYLGVLGAQLPPAAGGKPEQARAYFERAIQVSGGRNLMIKVLFARYYARLVFDQALHDRLLQEVLDAPVRQPGLTLTNVIAKQRAARLLAGSKDFF